MWQRSIGSPRYDCYLYYLYSYAPLYFNLKVGIPESDIYIKKKLYSPDLRKHVETCHYKLTIWSPPIFSASAMSSHLSVFNQLIWVVLLCSTHGLCLSLGNYISHKHLGLLPTPCGVRGACPHGTVRMVKPHICYLTAQSENKHRYSKITVQDCTCSSWIKQN